MLRNELKGMGATKSEDDTQAPPAQIAMSRFTVLRMDEIGCFIAVSVCVVITGPILGWAANMIQRIILLGVIEKLDKVPFATAFSSTPAGRAPPSRKRNGAGRCLEPCRKPDVARSLSS